jgi:site-specific DNA-methyltransferase (adenine-specific)
MTSYAFHKADCLTHMRTMDAKSIDFIYWNPPFGTTQQPWDERLDWSALFSECFRILKEDGNLVIHCSIPFNYTLIRSAPRPPSYSWYWDKGNVTLPLIVNHQPLRCVEEVLVWKMKKGKYFPQRVGDEERSVIGRYVTKYVMATRITDPVTVRGKCQTHLLAMPRTLDGFSTRSEDMVELFMKSYTREGDTILDPTCYKGLTGKVAQRMGRNWIGIDKYFEPEIQIEPSAVNEIVEVV